MCRLHVKLSLGFMSAITQLFRSKTQPSASLYHLAKQPFSKPHIRRFSVTAAPLGWSYHYEKPFEEKWPRTHFSPFNFPMQRWPADTPVDRSCNDVRKLINRLIDSRECTKTSICDQIGVSRTSFYAFMGQDGTWNGRKTDTFPLALHYFQQRERDGVPMPRKYSPRKRKPTAADLIVLEGQDEDKVPVFDTCNTIRRKINAYMRRDGVTQRTFLPELSAQFCKTPTVITSSHFAKFRLGKGPNIGNANPVFYAAYVFFEKARVAAKTKKSRLRNEMEKIYLETGGVNVKVPSGEHGAWLDGETGLGSLRIDKYGLASLYEYPKGWIFYGPQGYTCPHPYVAELRFFQYD